MKFDFPQAVPEIPVSNLKEAAAYYERSLGFQIDWTDEVGITGISKGQCRMFLTDDVFRTRYRNTGPILVWLNLDSKKQVDALYELWHASQAKIVSPPESKPWGLHEFTAADLDGNLIRVFYDFATPERLG
ncbi:MAG TPA: VOC family protein [Chryseosolibacter sp.]|nr:VOC family protein [Chryseosolibacter sp.]